MNRLICFVLFVALGFSQIILAAEDDGALFEYPQVPDTISSLERRSDFFVSKFWENLDMSKQIKDKEAFKSAFVDYVTFFPYANRQVVTNSLADLFYKAQANSANIRLLAETAEATLYDISSVARNESIYLVFLTKILENSSLNSVEKLRYQTHLDILNNNKLGAIAKDFKYKDLKGKNKSTKLAKPKSDYSIIYFNDPNCEECLIGRLRLSVDVEINKLIKEGKVILYSISLCDYSKEWAEQAKDYSDLWEIGATPEVYDIYDLRLMPNLYIMDSEGRILAKNVAKLSDILDVVNGK